MIKDFPTLNGSFPRRTLAWIPIVFLLASMAVLWAIGDDTSFESPLLHTVLNFTTRTLASVVIIFLFSRRFLDKGEPGLLLICCGIGTWGITGVIATAFVSMEANIGVTISNIGIWLSALFHLAGSVTLLRFGRKFGYRALWLCAGLAMVTGIMALTTFATLSGWLPLFFVQGQGGTITRHVVLGSAIVMFALTSMLLRVGNNRPLSDFLFWYCLALVLIAVGQLGLALESARNSLLDWTCRAAHYSSGIYMLIAAFVSRRAYDLVSVPRSASPDRTRYSYALAISMVLIATAIRLVFLQALGTRTTFITFYPAVILAALFGGLRAGLLASFLSALVADFFWIGLPGFANGDAADWLALGVFLGSCIVISHIAEAMHRAQVRATNAEAEARIAAEREKREERLEFQDNLLSNISDVVYSTDTEFRITSWNRAAEKIYGKKEADVLGKSIFETVGSKFEPERRKALLEEIMKTGSVSTQINHTTVSGELVEFDSVTMLMRDAGGKANGFIGVNRDITERKRAEKELRKSEERFQLALKNAPVSVAVQDRNLQFIWAYNQRTIDLSAVLGKSDYDLFAPEDAAHLVGLKRKAMETGLAVREECWITSSGKRVFLDLYIEPFKNRAGDVTGVGIATVDLTQMKITEDALRESEERFRNLVKYAPAAIYEMDLAGTKFISVNDVMCSILGYSREELLSMNPGELLDEGSRSLFKERISKKFSGDKIDEAIEYRIRRKDGTWIYTLVSVSAFTETGDGSPTVSVIGYDVTERKRAEEVLLRAKKLGDSLARINRALHSTLEWSEVAQILIAEGTDAIGSQSAAISLRKGNETWLVSHVFKMPADLVGTIISDEFESHALLSYRSRQPVAVTDAINDERFNREHLRKHNIRAVLVIPLISHNEPFGVMYFNYHDGPHEFGETEVEFARQLAATASIAMDNASLFEERRKSEEALAETRDHLEKLVNYANAPIIVWDTDLRITKFNHAFEKMTGYEAGEVLGSNLHVLFPEENKIETLAKIERTVGGEYWESIEIPIRRKNGNIRWALWNSANIYDKNGTTVVSTIAQGQDITERKLAEEALARQATMLSAVNDAIIGYDSGFRVIYWNAAAERMFGYAADEVVGEAGSTLFGTIFIGASGENLAERLAAEGHVETESIRTTRDGRTLTIEAHVIAMKDGNGGTVGYLSVDRDITERRRLEDSLENTLRRFYLILSNMRFGLLLVTDDNRIEFVNRAFCDLFGLEDAPSDLLSLDSKEVIEKIRKSYKDPDAAVARIAALVDSEKSVIGEDVQLSENRTLLRDFIPIRIGGKSFGRLWVHVDMTDRTKAEDTLRKNEEELRKLNRMLEALSDSNQAIMRAENEKDFLAEICRIIVDTCGYSMAWIGFACDDDAKNVRPAARAGIDDAYLESVPITWNAATQGQEPAGTAIGTGSTIIRRNLAADPDFEPWREEALKRGFASAIALPLKSEGTTFGAIAIYSGDPDPFSEKETELLTELADDLSYGILTLRLRAEHAQAEEALAAGRNLLRSIIDNATALVYVFDLEARFLIANKAIANLLNLSPASLIGKKREEMMGRETAEAHEANDLKVLNTGKPMEFEEYGMFDGRPIVFLTTKFPLYDTHGNIYAVAGISSDISDRKKAEEILKRDKDEFESLVGERTKELLEAQMELIKAKRLSDIGTLAATVAHELRNPLAAMKLAAHNIRRKVKIEEIDKHIVTIEKKVSESNQIINNLLFYSRFKLPHHEKIDIFEILEESIEGIEERETKEISVSRNIDCLKSLDMEADPIQLKEVFNNLLINAFDAVSSCNGTICVGAANEAGFVTVTIEDNGCGIDRGTLDRIFDPFFTTKANGTGLGLSVCKQIVEYHQGSIGIESLAGTGTKVTVRLPKGKK